MSQDYGSRAARRLRRTVGVARRRVADASRLGERVARLDKRLRKVDREVADLRRAVARLEGGSGAVTAASGSAQRAGRGMPPPVDVGAVTSELAPDLERVVTRVVEEHLSYVGRAGLRTLATVVSELETAEVPGLIVETGTALGGSAIVMAAAKSAGRSMKVYDVFGMIPPPGGRDGEDVHDRYQTIAAGGSQGLGGQTYYGYRDDLLTEVADSFDSFGLPLGKNNVELVSGLFEDTITLDEPVALAHLDGDWYESTMTCLTRIAPLISHGGRLVIDDYDAWSGCRTAVDEYFVGHTGFRLERRGKLHVVRI